MFLLICNFQPFFELLFASTEVADSIFFEDDLAFQLPYSILFIVRDAAMTEVQPCQLQTNAPQLLLFLREYTVFLFIALFKMLQS